jgi:hypothetical protein
VSRASPSINPTSAQVARHANNISSIVIIVIPV